MGKYNGKKVVGVVRTIDSSGQEFDVLNYLSYNSTKKQIDASKPVVEAMEGYSYVAPTDHDDFTPIYVGMVKNGNKLTIVQSGILQWDGTTPTGGIRTQRHLGTFNLPQSVMDKIFPLPQDQWNQVANIEVGLYEVGSYSSPAFTKRLSIGKYGWLGTNLVDLGDLDPTKQYYLRWELTLLLSDNLASQE